MTPNHITSFYFMRHGEKPGLEEDDITDFGEAQVVRFTDEHLLLDRWSPDYWLFHSDTLRTRKSIAAVERELRESSAGIEVQNRGVHELVGMDWLQDASLPNFDFMRMEHELRRRYGDALTVSHWLEHFPPAWGFRERLKRFMAEVMAEIRAHNEQKLTSGQGWRPVNVVVGSHTPIAEFALLDPKMGTGLGHADAVLYEVNSDGAIVGHEHLRCSLTR